MRRVKLLNKAWQTHPPVNWLVAAYLDYKSPEQRHQEAIDNTRLMIDRVMKSGGNVPIR